MSNETRPYTMKRRAEQEALTRLRITESAMELHGTVGPSRTTISAVAERAGVRRSTVYRHFPDQAALYTACSSHWVALNPLPDIGGWAAIADPHERLRAALTELYAHFRRSERMWDNLTRDEDLVPILKRLLTAYHGYLEAATDTLVAGTRARGRARQRVRAAIGHALAFSTWRSLAREQGLDDGEAVELMCRLMAAGPSTR